MAQEEQEIHQLEEKMERLENKLRATFQEVEKRFVEMKTQPVEMEDRLQELEDLILMMQLEITKIKDRTSVVTEFLTPQTPDINQRLSKLEEAIGLKTITEDNLGENFDDAEPRPSEKRKIDDDFYVPMTEEKAPRQEPDNDFYVSLSESPDSNVIEARPLQEEKTDEREEHPSRSLLTDVRKILSE